MNYFCDVTKEVKMKESLLLVFMVLTTLLAGCQQDIIEEPETPLEPETPQDTIQEKINGVYYQFDLQHKTAKVQKWAEDYSDSVSIPSAIGYEGQDYRVTGIGDSAFCHCDSLTALTISMNVKSIGGAAFGNCGKLVTITCRATIPPTIETNTFHGVDISIPVYVPKGSVEAYQTAEHWNRFTNIQCFIASGACGDNLTV